MPEVGHRNWLCNKCGDCVEVCDVKAISIADKGVKINRQKCTSCGKCVEVCNPGALRVFGYETTTEKVLDEIMRDEAFYRDSGGGVTVSGGEPIFQVEFAADLLEQCQAKSIHMTLDTCGYGEPAKLERVLKYTDLVLHDLKLMNPSEHRRLTGRSNEQVLRNLESIVSRGIPTIVRVPLIPTITDSEENILAIARYVAGLRNPVKVELLPYHELGVSKYEMLDRPYNLAGLKSQGKEEQDRSKRIIESFGIECELGK